MAQARLGFVQGFFGAIGATLIRAFIRVFGRTIDIADAPWLVGPIGPDELEVGDRPYAMIAERERLTLVTNAKHAGLVPDFTVLDGPLFQASDADREVRRFYEETARYHLEVWSHAPFPGRLFLWLLVSTVSRAMNQLNFPVTALELSRGMTSEVLPMKNERGETVYTGWLRRAALDARIVYTGFYATEKPPGHPSRCVKVVFPLPRGNATVILKPLLEDGRFRLISGGSRFGDPGFYRVVKLDERRLKVRYMKSLHEHFAVYRDDAGTLRCDHDVHFLGMTILKLHYKMVLRSEELEAAPKRELERSAGALSE